MGSASHLSRASGAYLSVIMGAPMSSFTVDTPEKAFLNEHDYTAVSFWIISIAMIASTVSFFAEAATVSSHWRTSLHVGGLVTLVAAVHYMYMREYWVAVAMLAFGYAGESGAINAWIGFFFGMCGWAFILFEIFAGESSAGAGKCSDAVKQSFNNMRIIVSVGWAIYPAGYFLGQVNRTQGAAQALNVTYNIADFVNKIGFVLACWSCAKIDTESKRAEALLA